MRSNMNAVMASPTVAPRAQRLSGRNALIATGLALAFVGGKQTVAPTEAFAGGGVTDVVYDTPPVATPAPVLAPTVPGLTKSTVTIKLNTETKRDVVLNASDVDSASVNILGNISAKPIPKKQLKKLRKQKKCKTFDGTKVKIMTAGLGTGNMEVYGQDTRKSEFCKIAGRWIRVKCKNPSYIKAPVPKRYKVVANPVFVKNRAATTLQVEARSSLTVACEVEGAKASASASGYANAYIKLNAYAKGKGSISSKISAEATAKAYSEARAEAHCAGKTTTIITETITPGAEVCPPGTNPTDVDGNGTIDICAKPKDGTEGLGEGTPNISPDGSTVGGPGTPNEPAPKPEAFACYDSKSSTNGDLDPATEGATLYVANKANVNPTTLDCIGAAVANKEV